jgi:hypothetical protein
VLAAGVCTNRMRRCDWLGNASWAAADQTGTTRPVRGWSPTGRMSHKSKVGKAALRDARGFPHLRHHAKGWFSGDLRSAALLRAHRAIAL